jgi:thioredoxin 1
MKLLTSTFLFSAIALFWVACTPSADAEFNLDSLSFEQKIEANPEAVILDVRTQGEYFSGHIPDAVNNSWTDAGFLERIKAANNPKDQVYLVYCQSGKRSAAAVSKMRNEGYIQVYELKGGIMSWKQAGGKLQ